MGWLSLLIKTGIALVLLSSTCFACPHGYFGLDCLHKCSTYCSGNESCNPITGVCDEGCKDGWSGSKCGTQKNTECAIGYFGPECSTKCGHCLNASQCHRINGMCLYGCSKGYKGEFCKESCPHGYFGINCVHKCSTYCSGNESCNRFTGVCDEGCKDGWSGSKCGTRINTEGSNDISPSIIGAVSGLVISIGLALLTAWLRVWKACCSGEDSHEPSEDCSNSTNSNAHDGSYPTGCNNRYDDISCKEVCEVKNERRQPSFVKQTKTFTIDLSQPDAIKCIAHSSYEEYTSQPS